MIRDLAISTLDFLLGHYGLNVRRKRARQLSIESAFSPATCERLLEVCDDRVELARQCIHVAMFMNESPITVAEDAKAACGIEVES